MGRRKNAAHKSVRMPVTRGLSLRSRVPGNWHARFCSRDGGSDSLVYCNRDARAPQRGSVRHRVAIRVSAESEHEKEGNTNMSEAQKPTEQAPQEIIYALAVGYMISRSLHVAADLGIADLLSDGPKSIEELVSATGAHRQSLYRLLRLLAGNGVFAEDPSGHFQLTPPAVLLRTGVPGSLRDIVRTVGDLAGDGTWWNMVGQLRRTVLTGEPEFERVYGIGFYEHLARNPAANVWWAQGMLSQGITENAAIGGCYDFGQFRRVVDVGGGRGGFLAEVLKAYPTVKGVLYDHPKVMKEPTSLIAAGLMDRCEVGGGNFLESVPGGADAYIAKRILMDWDDEHVVALLRACREAMAEHGRIVTINVVMPLGNQPHPGKIIDLFLMVQLRGRERTEQEFRELYRRAGLKLTKIVPTPSMLSLVEGERA